MKRITVGLFIVLFCFSVGIAQGLSEAYKKEVDEFLRKAAWLNFSYWVEDENLRKLKTENDRLDHLIWELDSVKSDIRIERMELDFLRTSYIFMPYLWIDSWRTPLGNTSFTTPNWTNYFWLYYYRR